MKCLILAAGHGTRLYPMTIDFPKPLLKVKDKSIIDWLIENLEQTKEIDEYIIVSNHKFINYFNEWRENKPIKEKIIVLDDGTTNNDNRLGAVADISFAIKSLNINEDLMVLAGDNILDFSLNTFINYFNCKKSTCIMRYYEEKLEKIKKSASVKIDNNDLVTEMIEKPLNPDSHFCVPPFYIYAKDDVNKVEIALSNGCKKDSPGSFISWLYNKSSVFAMEMPGKRYDIGTIENYQATNKMFNGILNKVTK